MKFDESIKIKFTGALGYLLGKQTVEIPYVESLTYPQLVERLNTILGKKVALCPKGNFWMLTIDGEPTISLSISVLLNGNRWVGTNLETEKIPAASSMEWLAPVGGG